MDLSVGLGGCTELRSLSESATYEAWVAAHSAAGEGEPSAPQPATTTSRGKVSIILNINVYYKLITCVRFYFFLNNFYFLWVYV